MVTTILMAHWVRDG